MRECVRRTPRPQLGLSSDQVELQLWWGVAVSQSTGEIITLADSVVPTGVSFGNLAAMKLRCLPLFFLAGATRAQCDACAERKKRRKKRSSDMLYLKRCGVLAQTVSRRELRSRDA